MGRGEFPEAETGINWHELAILEFLLAGNGRAADRDRLVSMARFTNPFGLLIRADRLC